MAVEQKTRPAAARDVDADRRWIQLLDQLDAVMLTARSEEAQLMFPCFRPRRRSTAFRHLLLERRRVLLEMDRADTPRVGHLPMPPSCSALSRKRPLDVEFEILADAFDRCAEIASRRGQAALAQWLQGRARMHRSHALFIATY